MKYNYVYIITNKLNHKFYIGKHSTNNLDDGYMGSGITIRNAIKKYGLENFSKRILCFCDSDDDAYKVEEFLVTENLIKRADCYNLKRGGKCGLGSKGRYLSDETKLKISEFNKGKHLSKKTKQKIRDFNIGKHLSDETKLKISDAHKGKTTWNKGKHHSEESKTKMRLVKKGVHRSEETKQKISESMKLYLETKRKNNITNLL